MRYLYNIFFYLALIFILFFTLQCNRENNNTKNPVISKETFIKFYTESLTIKYSDLSFEKIDSSMIKLYQKYNIAVDKYNQLENYYKENPKEWLEILAKIDEKIKGFSEDEEIKNSEK